MQLEKYYTCYIERRLHIPYNPASARLTTGLLILNALIQLKIIQYWWWLWRQWCRDVASGIDKHPDRTEIYFRLKFISDCRYRVIESSSLVPVLFREVFSHPYISFFHLLVNVFFVIYIYMDTTVDHFTPLVLRVRGNELEPIRIELNCIWYSHVFALICAYSYSVFLWTFLNGPVISPPHCCHSFLLFL